MTEHAEAVSSDRPEAPPAVASAGRPGRVPDTSRGRSRFLAASYKSRVRALADELETLRLGGPPVLESLVPKLRALLSADVAVAYLTRPAAVGHRLDFLHIARAGAPATDGERAEMAETFNRFLRTAPLRWAHHDPVHPEPEQRNVVFRGASAPDPGESADGAPRVPTAAHGIPPPRGGLLERLGVAGLDRMRVLVCEGDSLLAWLGVLRQKPFTARDARALGTLVPWIQRRLSAERTLAAAAVMERALGASLEAHGGAAWVVRGDGAVVLANAEARDRLAEATPELQARLASLVATGGEEGRARVRHVGGVGTAAHYVIVEGGEPDLPGRLARARDHWGLTARQAAVLALVAEGLTNRAIAEQLACSEGTVEMHVASVMAKAHAENRTALVARLWLGA